MRALMLRVPGVPPGSDAELVAEIEALRRDEQRFRDLHRWTPADRLEAIADWLPHARSVVRCTRRRSRPAADLATSTLPPARVGSVPSTGSRPERATKAAEGGVSALRPPPKTVGLSQQAAPSDVAEPCDVPST